MSGGSSSQGESADGYTCTETLPTELNTHIHSAPLVDPRNNHHDHHDHHHQQPEPAPPAKTVGRVSRHTAGATIHPLLDATIYLDEMRTTCLSRRQPAQHSRGRGEETAQYRGWAGGGVHFTRSRRLKTIGLRIPTNAATEHVGFLPTRQTSRAPSAKSRQVFSESHEG